MNVFWKLVRNLKHIYAQNLDFISVMDIILRTPKEMTLTDAKGKIHTDLPTNNDTQN